MDELDRRIIELLQQNSRMTSSDMSKEIHLSVPAIAERIRKLEQNGVIDQFTIKLNRQAVGQHCLVYIFVMIQGSEHIESFRQMIIEAPEVLECNHIAGEYDYVLKVALPHVQALETFISTTLKSNRYVTRTNTVFILSTLKE